MDLRELLRELRLMKGQQGYRYCLSWILVAMQVARVPIAVIVLWSTAKSEFGLNVLKVVTPLITQFIRELK